MNAVAGVAAIREWAAARALDFRHDDFVGHGAVFSRCGRYRYLLWRDATDARVMLGFGMLNPSRADHLANDPTIARCHRRAREEGAALLAWPIAGAVALVWLIAAFAVLAGCLYIPLALRLKQLGQRLDTSAGRGFGW